MEQKRNVLAYGKRGNRPMLVSYRPELDVSLVLNPKETQEHQQFIGITRWIIELERFDILCEVSLLSSHLSMPQKGHMDRGSSPDLRLKLWNISFCTYP